jgi:hypothetical protein
MTKEQAVAVTQQHFMDPNTNSSEAFVNSLIGLGILSVDEPLTATERAVIAINEWFGTRHTSEEILALMEEANVRIVDAV